jgi:hypothetical protein
VLLGSLIGAPQKAFETAIRVLSRWERADVCVTLAPCAVQDLLRETEMMLEPMATS